ncbi:MAG: hypothetical protein U0903_06560 [Planctomycetales bacterium]
MREVFTADYTAGALSDFLASTESGRRGGRTCWGARRCWPRRRRGQLKADPLAEAAAVEASADDSGGIPSLPVGDPHSFTFQHGGEDYVAAVETFQRKGCRFLTVVLVPEDDIIGPVKEAAVRTAESRGAWH